MPAASVSLKPTRSSVWHRTWHLFYCVRNRLSQRRFLVGAVLNNMARGSLVDEVALLRSGVWAGIGQVVRIVERTRTPSAGGITFRRRQLTGPCSSVVEHTLGKGEVVSSILTMGSG